MRYLLYIMQIDTYISFHRGGVAVKSTPAPPEPEEDREKFQEVTPKTYQVLQKELPQAEATGGEHLYSKATLTFLSI